MSHDETNGTDRRTFLQAGALATAAALGATSGAEAQDAAAKTPVLPKRKLGKTGLEITMLEMGTGALASAACSSDSEVVLRQRRPHVRHRQDVRHRARLQEVVRAVPRGPQGDRPGHQGQSPRPEGHAGDARQAARGAGVDYVDLFFIHGLGDDHKLDDAMNFVKGQEFKETAEAIRKSGKAKFVGFSSHHRNRARSSRRRPRAGSSTRSCSSTPPGSTRMPRSTRRSTPATRRASA